MNNKIYIGQGYNQSTGRSDHFAEYDPSTNTWTRKADFPGGGIGAVGFAVNGKGYFLGGDGNNTANGIQNWAYDPSQNTWTRKANFPISTSYGVAFVIGNTAYVGTGMYCNSSYCKAFYKYDATNDQWQSITDFPGVGRYGAVAFSIGNYGYVGTGTDGWTELRDFYRYDPSLNSWTQIADYAGTRPVFFASAFSIDNYGYVGTGFTITTAPTVYSKEVWEYDADNNSWTRRADFGGTGRHYAVAGATDSKLYIGTGTDGGDRNDFWEYAPDNNVVTAVNNGADEYVLLFPNPGISVITVPENITSLFYNNLGEIVLSATTNVVDVSLLPSGIYTVQLTGLDKVHYVKFLKQ